MVIHLRMSRTWVLRPWSTWLGIGGIARLNSSIALISIELAPLSSSARRCQRRRPSLVPCFKEREGHVSGDWVCDCDSAERRGFGSRDCSVGDDLN